MTDQAIDRAAAFLAAARLGATECTQAQMEHFRKEVRTFISVSNAIKMAGLSGFMSDAVDCLLVRCTSPGCDWAGPHEQRLDGAAGENCHCPACRGSDFTPI
jgi:hypothetical protein